MKKSKLYQWLIIGVTIILIITLWFTDDIKQGYFVYEVPKVTLISFLESRYLYWYIHAFTFIPVFCLSFDKRVHYYKEWQYLWKGILIVGIAFIIWDMMKTYLGVWGFNPNYISGIFIANLPIEECFFFLTVPFACIFIYECLNYYFPKDIFLAIEKPLTYALSFIFLLIGVWSWNITYSCTTYLVAGFYLLWHILYVEDAKIRSRFYLAYLVTWLPFILVDGVLTGGYQKEPIILYNPEEFLGFRVTSLPFEDSIYLIPLFLGIITIFEQERKAKKVKSNKNHI
jgi:lycopene cyclase domain-containing protein